MYTNTIYRFFCGPAILLWMVTISLPARCQQSFEEGSIIYNVSIGSLPGQEQATKHAGTFSLIIKGRMVRKELKLDNGYQSTIIYNGNTNTAYSLKTMQDKRYAIQLNIDELNGNKTAYEGFKLQQTTDKALTIAGWPCYKATVTYKNGTSGNIYISRDWYPANPDLFERLPGIKYFPLSFEYKNDDGVLMLFHAEKMEAVPEESAQFRIPPDYKIISNQEYRTLNK
ncbi:hypothetical protein ACTHGU_13765 [Chitinophagaceae bacterium MMS25-I14]